MPEGLTPGRMLLIIVAVSAGSLLILSSISLPLPPRAPELKTVHLAVVPGPSVNRTDTVVVVGTALDAAGTNVTASATWAWDVSNGTALQILSSTQAWVFRATAVATGTVDVAVNVTLANVMYHAATTLTIGPAPLGVASAAFPSDGGPEAVPRRAETILASVRSPMDSGAADSTDTLRIRLA